LYGIDNPLWLNSEDCTICRCRRHAERLNLFRWCVHDSYTYPVEYHSLCTRQLFSPYCAILEIGCASDIQACGVVYRPDTFLHRVFA
jgi:hypothetical protein